MKKKTNNSATRSQQNCNETATRLRQTRFLFVPLLHQFRRHLRKDFTKSTPQTWIPVECSLLIRYEFAALSPQVRYIFVAILLYCGARGTDEIPVDIGFLANALAVDGRMLKKSLLELEKANLLRERKKEREEKDRQTEPENGVSADFGFVISDFGLENSDLELKTAKDETKSEIRNHKSQFTLEECLKYVEICQGKGDAIQNPKGLANHLHKTGEADSFILATLFPEKQTEIDLEKYGEPRQFSDEPCTVCFGSKMADTDGKGFRKCTNCLDEKGKSTGFEPLGENEND